MAKLIVSNFSGEMPRVAPTLLRDNFATVARNVELRRGRIEPCRVPLSLNQTLRSNSQTIFHFNKTALQGQGFWFEFASDVDVVRGQIVGDTDLTTMYTGDGVPKITTAALAQQGVGPYPAVAHDLGLPAPPAPTVTGSEGELPEGGQKISTAYRLTWVNHLAQEGPPSAPSQVVERWDGAPVTLGNLALPSGNFQVLSKRLYRVEYTGSYQFVAELPATQLDYVDAVASKALGEPVPSVGWIAPSPNMVGLTELPNGGMMGWFGNTLAFSEPYQVHAWPLGYQLALGAEIVGAAVTTTGILITTEAEPYLIVGSHPSSMRQIKLDVVQACVAKRSVVDMGSFALYASADGLVAGGGAEPQLISESMILPSQWRAMFKPASIHAYRYEGRYLAFYDNGQERGGFSFHPQDGFRFFDAYCDCAYLDRETGRLYVQHEGELKAWDEGEPAAYVWQSKTWETPVAGTLSAAKVTAEHYPVEFELFADGEMIKHKHVLANKAFRLPDAARYRLMHWRVRGQGAISHVQLASSMSEIS